MTDFSTRPQIYRGHGQSREERKAADQARIDKEKLLRQAAQYLTEDDLRQIIAEGEKRA